MTNPLVSVLIPCYNVEKYVIESITSILNQTYSNLEIIAINDCSTDTTGEKLEYLSKLDSRIKVFNNESNLKLISTLNKGIHLCNGEYIARMDADDISLPTRIEKQVQYLSEKPDYDIVSTQFYTFRTGKKKKNLYKNPTLYEELQAYLLFKSGICHPASMIRKTLFTEKGLIFEHQYLHVEDYALWSKSLYCTKLGNINEPLLLYRVHESQVSSLNELKQIENKKEVFKIHCLHLNIPLSENLLDIYASVAESVPREFSFEYLSQCEKFIQDLIEMNKSKIFCSQLFLERMLSLHWLRLCANSRLGLNVIPFCKKSKLYKKENYKTVDLIILYIKCLFRLEYKKSFLYDIVFR